MKVSIYSICTCTRSVDWIIERSAVAPPADTILTQQRSNRMLVKTESYRLLTVDSTWPPRPVFHVAAPSFRASVAPPWSVASVKDNIIYLYTRSQYAASSPYPWTIFNATHLNYYNKNTRHAVNWSEQVIQSRLLYDNIWYMMYIFSACFSFSVLINL